MPLPDSTVMAVQTLHMVMRKSHYIIQQNKSHGSKTITSEIKLMPLPKSINICNITIISGAKEMPIHISNTMF
jgi:hypothetical protein